MAIMYCTQQVIQGENFCDWLKSRKSFSPRKFCSIRYLKDESCSYQDIMHMVVYTWEFALMFQVFLKLMFCIRAHSVPLIVCFGIKPAARLLLSFINCKGSVEMFRRR